MTAVATPEVPARPGQQPRTGQRRQTGQGVAICVRLLKGSVVGAHVGLLVAVLGAALLHGTLGAVNAALAGALVMAFFASGQGVQLVAAELADGTGMVVVLASYLLRVVALGALLWLATTHQAGLDAVFLRSDFFAGAACTLVGWLGGMFWTYAHTRFHVYDRDYAAGPDGRPGGGL